MDDKRLIDWENLFNLTHEVQSICGTCPSANKCRIRNRPPDCPIWASLEEAPESPKPEPITTRKHDCGDPPDGEGLMSYRKEA